MHVLDNWDWEPDAVLFLRAEVDEAKAELDKTDKATDETDVPSPSVARPSAVKSRRPPCEMCRSHSGLKNCHHKPGSRFCAWFAEVETIWPGRFFWSDLNQAWEETEGDWAPACDVEVTDELVEDALALLGLRRGYDAKTLESCYRKRALAIQTRPATCQTILSGVSRMRSIC